MLPKSILHRVDINKMDVVTQKLGIQLEYVSVGDPHMMFGCRAHLYLQFLLQLVHLYSMNHILQAEMLFLWQKIFIPRERLMSALWYFCMFHPAGVFLMMDNFASSLLCSGELCRYLFSAVWGFPPLFWRICVRPCNLRPVKVCWLMTWLGRGFNTQLWDCAREGSRGLNRRLTCLC